MQNSPIYVSSSPLGPADDLLPPEYAFNQGETVSKKISPEPRQSAGIKALHQQPNHSKKAPNKRPLPYALPAGPYSASKPPRSVASVIGQALLSAPDHALTCQEIFDWISTVHPYFCPKNRRWKTRVQTELMNLDVFHMIGDGDNDTRWTILERDLGRFANGRYLGKAVPTSHSQTETQTAKRSADESAAELISKKKRVETYPTRQDTSAAQELGLSSSSTGHRSSSLPPITTVDTVTPETSPIPSSDEADFQGVQIARNGSSTGPLPAWTPMARAVPSKALAEHFRPKIQVAPEYSATFPNFVEYRPTPTPTQVSDPPRAPEPLTTHSAGPEPRTLASSSNPNHDYLRTAYNQKMMGQLKTYVPTASGRLIPASAGGRKSAPTGAHNSDHDRRKHKVKRANASFCAPTLDANVHALQTPSDLMIPHKNNVFVNTSRIFMSSDQQVDVASSTTSRALSGYRQHSAAIGGTASSSTSVDGNRGRPQPPPGGENFLQRSLSTNPFSSHAPSTSAIVPIHRHYSSVSSQIDGYERSRSAIFVSTSFAQSSAPRSCGSFSSASASLPRSRAHSPSHVDPVSSHLCRDRKESAAVSSFAASDLYDVHPIAYCNSRSVTQRPSVSMHAYAPRDSISVAVVGPALSSMDHEPSSLPALRRLGFVDDCIADGRAAKRHAPPIGGSREMHRAERLLPESFQPMFFEGPFTSTGEIRENW